MYKEAASQMEFCVYYKLHLNFKGFIDFNKVTLVTKRFFQEGISYLLLD